MMLPTLGDQSHSLALRQRTLALRAAIERHTQELSSGQVAEVREVLRGNLGHLTDLERRGTLLEGYRVATTEARHLAGGMQLALGEMQEATRDLSGSLITAGTSGLGAAPADIAQAARGALEELVARVNTSVSGRYLMAGSATDRVPLPPAADLLTALSGALAGAATPADMMSAAEAWFADPAGYGALYQGSATPLSPLGLSPGEAVPLELTALDPEIARSLRLTALAALAEDPAFGLDAPQQRALFAATGQEMLAARDGITALGARVGFVEARIEAAESRNAAEATALDYARNELLEVDPFEAATRLEAAQFQLESLYRVTVRNAQLSLVNFL